MKEKDKNYYYYFHMMDSILFTLLWYINLNGEGGGAELVWISPFDNPYKVHLTQ